MSDKREYTPKERQDYHYRMSKVGATKKVNDVNGHVVELGVSDFERGVHKAKADHIFNARKRKALENKNLGR